MVRMLLLVFLLVIGICGCAMFGAWKSIPPPGGCDRCHKVAISNNWTVTVSAAKLTDERGHNYWQQPESIAPEEPASPLEEKKITEQRCFRCHKEPNKAHRKYLGTYHH
jgi:hypothetical protein